MTHLPAFRAAALALLLAFSAMLCACQVNVYQGLTEQQATLMLGTLLKHGIRAEKSSSGKNGFSISVDDGQLIQSLEILKENNLPREDFQSLGTVFAGQGMIASPTEEQARLAYAISQELADTFSRIDGVLTARVHVVLGSTDQTTDVHTPPSAAVFLRHTPESHVINLIPKIRELTAKSVPALEDAQVSVMLVPLRETVGVPMRPELSFLGIPLSPQGRLPYAVLALFALLLCSCGGLGFWIFWLLRKKKQEKTAITEDAGANTTTGNMA